jgi:ABC-2 type transport system ATP-binding protein
MARLMENILEVRHLGKTFESFTLRDASFALPRGHIMGLIGPNGAGKTTTLRLILGLVKRDAGQVLVCGMDPVEQGASVRSRVGFVHDEPRFFSHLSLERNADIIARFYRTWDQEQFRRCACAFGLQLKNRFGNLSRGTKMKFALALALSHRADLILMDEPTSGLDPVFRRELLDALSGLLVDGNAAILFSTHITADLERIADFVTLLQGGRVVFSAVKDLVLENWGLVKGAPELLDTLPGGLFRGVRRGVHGFEALTDDAAGARRLLGDKALVEKPSLEDIIYYTSRGDGRV